MKKNLNSFLIIILYFVVINCSLVSNDLFANIISEKDGAWKNEAAYKPNPILFVHGFAAGSAKSWDKVVYFADPQDARGLRLYFYKYTQVTSNLDLSSPYLERVAFNDPNGSIDTYPAGKLNPNGNSKGWADKIDERIKFLLPIYKFKGDTPLKFILICHSMGGLAAREYVTNPKYSPADVNIDKIITIGTPHAGSPIANVKTIENATTSQYKYIWEVPYYGKTIVIQKAHESDSLITFVRGKYKVDLEGEAIKDMAVGSQFLMTFKDKPFPVGIKKFAIHGELNPLLSYLRYLNYEFFRQYYPLEEAYTCGDGIVPRDSQRGYDIMTEYPSKAYWVWQPDKIERVQADHITELESKETYQALLQFLDSTQPEFEITSPSQSIITEIKDPAVRITGKVYKEYLPADCQLIITLTRQEDGKLYPPQTSLLKASDLWIPNNPDSPVAEFDEVVNFPGNGTYEISCQLKNPAGLTSEIKKLKVKVSGLVTSIIVHCHNPEGKEINSIQGIRGGSEATIYDGSTRLGYSASSSLTHNKRFGLKEGAHTIKAIFNGITLTQDITLSGGETKVLTFTFPRTEFDIYSYIPSTTATISVSGTPSQKFLPGEQYYFHFFSADQNPGNIYLVEARFTYQGVQYLFWHSLLPTTYEGARQGLGCDDVAFIVNGSNPISVSVKGSYSVTVSSASIHWFGGIDFVGNITFYPSYIKISQHLGLRPIPITYNPRAVSFDRWFTQGIVPENFTNYASVRMRWAEIIPGTPHNSGYFLHSYDRRDFNNIIEIRPYFPGIGSAGNLIGQKSVDLTSNILQRVKISSVPYDLLGTGV